MSTVTDDKQLNDNLEKMALNDRLALRQKYSSLIEIEEKLQLASKENRIVQLTLQELKEIEGEAKFYESHGRAYVRKYKKEVVNNLESMSKAKGETIENLQKTREKRANELQAAAKKN